MGDARADLDGGVHAADVRERGQAVANDVTVHALRRAPSSPWPCRGAGSRRRARGAGERRRTCAAPSSAERGDVEAGRRGKPRPYPHGCELVPPRATTPALAADARPRGSETPGTYPATRRRRPGPRSPRTCARPRGLQRTWIMPSLRKAAPGRRSSALKIRRPGGRRCRPLVEPLPFSGRRASAAAMSCARSPGARARLGERNQPLDAPKVGGGEAAACPPAAGSGSWSRGLGGAAPGRRPCQNARARPVAGVILLSKWDDVLLVRCSGCPGARSPARRTPR